MVADQGVAFAYTSTSIILADVRDERRGLATERRQRQAVLNEPRVAVDSGGQMRLLPAGHLARLTDPSAQQKAEILRFACRHS
jgi:hypothetical protein